jgi:hypothetical protein
MMLHHFALLLFDLMDPRHQHFLVVLFGDNVTEAANSAMLPMCLIVLVMSNWKYVT